MREKNLSPKTAQSEQKSKLSEIIESEVFRIAQTQGEI